MLYELAHTLQKKSPWLWDGVEALNAFVCGMNFGDKEKLYSCLKDHVRLADLNDAGRLADFFARQPAESYKWFRPHESDEGTLRKLLTRIDYAFVVEVLEKESGLIGD